MLATKRSVKSVKRRTLRHTVLAPDGKRSMQSFFRINSLPFRVAAPLEVVAA